MIKTINGVHRPQALEEVLWAARGRPDVHVIDRSLSARERDALLVGCDCYVSLHRSEGFGLTLAECMALGKPVIGTAFSATTDFMTEENSYPVPYEMTRVGRRLRDLPRRGHVGRARRRRGGAAHASASSSGRTRRARRASAPARDIERLYSPAAVGEMIRARLEEISGALATVRRRRCRAKPIAVEGAAAAQNSGPPQPPARDGDREQRRAARPGARERPAPTGLAHVLLPSPSQLASSASRALPSAASDGGLTGGQPRPPSS